MEYQTFEQLALKVKGCYFAGSKRDIINKSQGVFTAQQIYRLQGQFTGGNDRIQVVSDLNMSKRILPMTAKDAEPVIKMGVYGGQRKDLFKLLVLHITDRDQNDARQLLGRNFTGFDNKWMYRELEQAGPYQGPPPVATVTGPGATIITSNIIVTHPVGTHYQDPISYVAQNAGTALFGGLFNADIPNQRAGVATAVTYQGNVQQGTQVVYPQPNHYPMTAQPPTAPYQPNLYPTLPAQSGSATEMPPAYTPVDANSYPPPNHYPPTAQNQYPPTAPNQYPPTAQNQYPPVAPSQQPSAPPSNITYPPTGSAPTDQGSQLPMKAPFY